jgi:uncharacterized coiled-coil DUF342 family protein
MAEFVENHDIKRLTEENRDLRQQVEDLSEQLQSAVEQGRKDAEEWKGVCDSYADENQRFHDRIETLTRERDETRELLATRKALYEHVREQRDNLQMCLDDSDARLSRMRAALEEISKPFPATIGPAEDMLEDWMSAAARMKAIAARVLADREEEGE